MKLETPRKGRGRLRRLGGAAVLLSLPLVAAQAAGDPQRGYTLYHAVPNSSVSCSNSACHGNDPSTNQNKVKNGSKPFKIYSAIKNDTGGMGVLQGKLSFADLKDIAAYIANPAAGTPAATAAAKADPVRGKVLYNGIEGMDFSCANSACHGPDPSQDLQSVQAAANKPFYLALTIGSNVGGMGIYKGYVSWQDLKDISAYVGDPAAAGGLMPTAVQQGLAMLPEGFDVASLDAAQRERIGLGSYWINGIAGYGHCPTAAADQAWRTYSELAALRPALPAAHLDGLMAPRSARSLAGQPAVSRWMCGAPDAQAIEGMRAYLAVLPPQR